MEYIAKKDALAAIDEAVEISYYDYQKIEDAINACKTVDVASVVHCKDCKYWYQCTSVQGICKHDCGLYTADYDDFCSYGKRKDGGEKE